MKKYFYLIMLPGLMLLQVNCGEQAKSNKPEIVKESESGYYTASQVTVKPVPKTKVSLSEVREALKDKTLFKKYGYGEHLFVYEIYISEKGTLDEIRIIEGMGDGLDEKIILPVIQKGWQYTPAQNNGKNVRSRIMSFWNFDFDKDGEFTINYFDNLSKIEAPAVSSSLSSGNQYFVAVEQMPEPVGGIEAIQKKIHYPEIARRAGVEGKVYVLAQINEQGDVDKAQIIRGLGVGLDEAAIDAVKQTKFMPGKQRGKPVKVQVSIPIVFKLQ